MSEIVVETTPQETIIEIDGGPTLTTVVEQEQQTLVETPAEPIIIDLNSGARGEPGSAILTGTGYPNMTDGSVGDIWLVKAGAGVGDFLIKRDTEWTIEGSLRGPAGGIDTINGYTGPDVVLQKGDIGLASVDNTADLDKPVSTATQAAITALSDSAVKLTGNQTIAGNKTFTGTTTISGLTTITTDTTIGGKLFLSTGSASIEMGRVDGSTSTPFIDFHSGATATDFDSRIIATGGNGTNGQGALTYQALTHTFNGTISGNGSGLTNLNGSNVASGTVADARLSTNVVLLNNAQTITGNKTFGGSAVLTVPEAKLRVGTATTGVNYVLVGDGSGYVSWGNPNSIPPKNETDNSNTYSKAGVYIFDIGGTTWTGEPYGTVLTNYSSPDRAFQIIVGKTNTVPRIRIGDSQATNGWRPWVQLADDSKVVHLAGTESITGIKTFTTNPIVPTPTAWNHAAHKQYVDDRINATIDAAPGTLDTLNELAAALGDDPNFATTVTNSIATKEPIINTGPAGQFYRADKTWAAPTPAQVGLGNVTNDAQVKVVGDQTIQNIKTFAGDTYISRLRSNSAIHTQTDTALGAAVGDAVITRRHSHVGSTNTYNLVDMVVRTSASAADWTTTAHYQGVAVDSSFLLSPLAASGSRLRTWIGRNPNSGTFTFGQEGETFMTLGYNALTLPPNMVITGTGSGLTSLNGSNISTGTVADARLSSNVALLGGSQTFSGTKTFSTAPAVPDNSFAIAKTNGLQAALDLRGVTMQLASTGGSAIYTRVATLNGLASTSGAQITLLIANQGNYGSAQRQTSMVHFGQRGDNAYSFNAWNFADNSTSTKWNFFVKQISTYVFELWAFRGTYDVASISVLGGWNYTLNGDSGTTTQPAGSTALGSPSTLTDAAVRVVHGSTASTARPASAAFVEWVGSVTPTNMATNDTWINTGTTGNTADNQPSGAVMASASSKTAAPAGWYWMEGQEILISGDTPLYNELTNNGTVFPYGANTNGSGAAGSTHFRLPNGKGRTIHHADITVKRGDNSTPFASIGQTGGKVEHSLSVAQMPQHNHGVSDPGHYHDTMGRTVTWFANNSWGATDIYFPVNAAGGDPGGIAGSNYLIMGSHWHDTYISYTGITTQNNGSSAAHDILQNYITMRWMIKR